MLAIEIIRTKRDGHVLTDPQIDAFVTGLVDESWSEGQIAALAMAILLRGMTRDECVALTRAMTRSGAVLSWQHAALPGPVLDKHSTGGVGDKVSLILAPLVAACGGVVPMISGRGLGHTGGTLDKLQALPGYTIEPTPARLLAVLREAGCAIVGASAQLAPADRRLYAVRDVTATVEAVPLITASILSKKLAAGLQALVLDVKVGNGAFCADLPAARELAASLVEVACGAGLPTTALLTDMNQVLGATVGHALEVQEAIEALTGAAREPRLLEVTLALTAQLLRMGGLAATLSEARAAAQAALASGRAAVCFAKMVAGLGGPADVLASGGAHLPVAPVRRALAAPRAGVVQAMDARAIGLALIALGGGRRHATDRVDPRVGFSAVTPIGTRVMVGQPLLQVHAASPADADAALAAVGAAFTISDATAPPRDTPLVWDAVAGRMLDSEQTARAGPG
jgi:thymidine phosphorylase